MILAVECYIISFNSIDPFTFIFPFIKSFLFFWFGGGGGVHFWPSHKLGVSFGYGDFFWGGEGGCTCNKFELVKKSPFSFLPP